MKKQQNNNNIVQHIDLFSSTNDTCEDKTPPIPKVTPKKVEKKSPPIREVEERTSEGVLQKDALELARENYSEYGKYLGQNRAYPNIYDGMKPCYKRAIYGMHQHNTHKIVKVAELAAHALPYHPHPTSISGVIVQLGEGGNNLKLMETQGNWGNSIKKVEPAADRYIGGYLSDLSESLFCDSVEYAELVKGEIDKDEPKALPTYLPLCFINGLKGIPSGLPSINIPTIDLEEMIDYYIDILKHKTLDDDYQPKNFPKPNYNSVILSSKGDWEELLTNGKGVIKFAPKMEINKDNTIVITELPLGKTVEHVRKLINEDIELDRIDLRDESGKDTRLVIEKVPYKKINMKDVYKKLYNKLQTSEAFNMAFYDQDRIYVPCGFLKVVKSNIRYLIETHRNRIKKQLEELREKYTVLEIIDKLKKGGNIKQLAELSQKEALTFIATKYKTTEDIANKVLNKPLSYLTKEHQVEIDKLKEAIDGLENDNRDIYEFLISKYRQIKHLIKKQLEKQAKTI